MKSFVCVCLLLLCGCGGPGLYPVSGTVTLDGKSIEGLMVGFSPAGEGISGAGRTDATGKYVITSAQGRGLPPGEYNISIQEITAAENSATEIKAVESSSNSAAYEQQAMGSASEYKAAERKSKKVIPAKYNAQSTLKETVAKTENTIDFTLSSK